MSEAIAFDTHRFVKNLTAHGFSEEQAEALATEQVNLLNSNLATKADIAEIQQDIAEVRREVAEVRREIEVLRQETKKDIEVLRQETKRDIEALRQETKKDIEILRQETKAEIAGVRREIEALKVDLLKWIFGAMFVQVGLIVTLLKLL